MHSQNIQQAVQCVSVNAECNAAVSGIRNRTAATEFGSFGMILDYSRRVRLSLNESDTPVGHRLDPLHIYNDACTRRARADTAASSPYKMPSSPLSTTHQQFLDTSLDHLLTT